MSQPFIEDSGAAAAAGKTGLRKTPSYWYEFQTYAKLRWFGRELLEIFTTEFRDRTKEYYIWAIHKGICSVNGKRGDPRQIISDGDLICNNVHRHEPPVTDEPIRILHRDDDAGILVIVKPGSIPVHAAGRYYKHTLTELLKSEHGIPRIYTVNRLDRLTSGIMVCATKKETATRISAQFHSGFVNKAYVCRVRGKFPEGEVVCKEPILTIDRQSGVNIVHPKGKDCETIFVRLSYDAEDDSSVVFCRPITGRTHQIRVHIQYLGHPICNDPIYGHDVWQRVDTSQFSQVVPDQWKTVGGEIGLKEVEEVVHAIKSEKDGQEDWARWKDEVLFKDLNEKEGLADIYVPGPNGKSSKPSSEALLRRALEKLNAGEEVPTKGFNRPQDIETAWQKRVREQSSDFCPECKIPLLPDPEPEELYIYLHAIKYWSDDWSFEDALPWWARDDWRSVPQRGLGSTTNGEKTLPKDLAAAQGPVTGPPPSSSTDAANFSDIQAKAAALAAPKPLEAAVRGIEIGRATQLIDLPLSSGRQATPPATSDTPDAIVLATRPQSFAASLVFEVFRGFEDFAQREILQQVHCQAARWHSRDPATTGVASVGTSLQSAHVRLGDPEHASLALRAYLDGDLCVAKSAYLLAGSSDFPERLYEDLKRDRLAAGDSRRAQKKAAERRRDFGKDKKKKRGTRKKDGKVVEGPRVADDVDFREKDDAAKVAQAAAVEPEEHGDDADAQSESDAGKEDARSESSTSWPSEQELLRLIDDTWNASLEARDKAFKTWLDVQLASMGQTSLRPEQLSYRASVDRSTYVLPSMTTQTLSNHVGILAWGWLNGSEPQKDDSEPPKWRVDLEQPLLDVTLKFSPGFGIADEFEKALDSTQAGSAEARVEGDLSFLLCLPEPFKQHPRRPAQRGDMIVGGTTMALYRAAALGLTLPVPQRYEEDGRQVEPSRRPERFRVLEPCCGHGSIVFEAASALESRGIKAEVLGCDVDHETIERTQKMAEVSGFSADDEGAMVKVGIQHVDATQTEDLLQFVGVPNSIDAIVTDLPWGRREKSAQSLSKLYHRFIESWMAVLRTGGSVVAITAEQRTLSRALKVYETTCRKGRKGSVLVCEELRLADGNDNDNDAGTAAGGDALRWVKAHEDGRVSRQASLDAQRKELLRKIEIGYHVYVFCIRKVAT
ncbi:uncharacterized protein PFL1_00189 [Pseudozyma flocculosa PF-1]|uniref:Related to DRAP deaminase RIB2 n=1 Tax=Pseudozyma flocculosa TaxID=84751 RepID=A0A5C3EU59_9BASI|nr:uncharacterized protein PFL1_00189 [Pseudozyma flocculosa PF-1]EPQ31991.1 hypothetical protein PFL1_00189 [Pseudozyma flocculosa PF-1]SPO35086.1 related to DRAP deaminase RIB2 [Pseudozyma flocculosa]